MINGSADGPLKEWRIYCKTRVSSLPVRMNRMNQKSVTIMRPTRRIYATRTFEERDAGFPISPRNPYLDMLEFEVSIILASMSSYMMSPLEAAAAQAVAELDEQ